MIHLLIGEKFCENNHITNKTNFLKGNFAPDLAEDKKQSHFSKDLKAKTFTDALINKIDLNNFSKAKFNLNDDYQKGVFLHLLTDYYFYNEYLINDPNYQQYKEEPYSKVKELMYKEYDFVGYYIKSNFPNLNYDLLPEVGNLTANGQMKIILEKQLLQIVNFCANLNLEKIYEKLIKTKTI